MNKTLWFVGIVFLCIIEPEIWLAVVVTALIGRFVIEPLLYPS